MKVGIVTDFYYPWVGGPSSAIRTEAYGLASRGHDVAILAPSTGGSASDEPEEALPVTRVPTVPVPFGYHMRAGVPPRGIGAWIQRERPDVLHVHHPFPISAAAVYEGRRRGIPLAATNHTIPECSLWGLRGTGPLHQALMRGFGAWIVQVLNQCQAVSTPTNTAAKLLHGAGYTREVAVISNGVDVERFSPGQPDEHLRARLGLDDRPILLYTGRLDAEKEMDVWLRAAQAVARQVDIQLVVGGEGSERQRLEGLARSLDLPITFIGYVPGHELPALYRLAAAYCITSRVELQSITCLEASASGLPIVAVSGGALPELVENGVNGFTVPPGDADSLAARLIEVMQDPERRAMMGRQSRQIALRHAVPRSIDAYERLLVDAVAAKGEWVGRAPAAG